MEIVHFSIIIIMTLTHYYERRLFDSILMKFSWLFIRDSKAECTHDSHIIKFHRPFYLWLFPVLVKNPSILHIEIVHRHARLYAENMFQSNFAMLFSIEISFNFGLCKYVCNLYMSFASANRIQILGTSEQK